MKIAKEITIKKYKYKFSVCTLVTNFEEYQAMIDSFLNKGFTEQDTEFLYVNNSQMNKEDGFTGLNKFIHHSQGEYIILCHQDIRLEFDNKDSLLLKLTELSKIDNKWAIVGNAGACQNFSKKYIRISDPHGEDKKIGSFPSKVTSLDENFILIKSNANLGLSRDLNGFHFYGTDLCTLADIRGYTSYVIDFHIRHLSPGNINKYFFECKDSFEKQYSNKLRSRFIQTSCTYMTISSSRFINFLLKNKYFYFLKTKFDKILK